MSNFDNDDFITDNKGVNLTKSNYEYDDYSPEKTNSDLFDDDDDDDDLVEDSDPSHITLDDPLLDLSDHSLVEQKLNNIQERFKNFEDILAHIRCQLVETHERDNAILKRMAIVNEEIAELNQLESFDNKSISEMAFEINEISDDSQPNLIVKKQIIKKF